MDREQPEAILAMNVLAATATTMALRLSRHPVRVVATLHEGLGRGRLLRRARCSYPHADAVVGVSRGVSGEFDKIPDLKSGRVHVDLQSGDLRISHQEIYGIGRSSMV